MKTWIKVILAIVLAGIVIQFIPVDTENKPVKPEEDFVVIYNTPQDVQALMKKACYDCHTNETKYPKYATFAPVSWSIKNHINQGRKYVNWSIWGTYNKDLQRGMLKNTINSMEHKTMPINGYMVYHPEARLTDAEYARLRNYFQEILDKETAK